MFDIFKIGAYYPQQVLETTCTQRNTAPVICGFFTSVLPSMGGVSQLVRLATWLCTGFQHPAHPIRLKPSLVGLTQLTQETIMSNQDRAAVRTTAAHPFFNYSIDRKDTLFTVREGVEFEALIEQLQCFLKSAHGTVEAAALEIANSNQLWSAVYLTEMCLALSTACVNSLQKESQS